IETLDANFEYATWVRRGVFLPEQEIWVIWDRIRSTRKGQIRQQWLVDVDIAVRQLQKNRLVLDDCSNQLHMQWLGDQPKINIAEGNPDSNSRRRLIGVRWKTMKPASSVHATFYDKHVESIVVISKPAEPNFSSELKHHNPMISFDLSL